MQTQPEAPPPPTLDEIIKFQRNNLMARVLDLEAENAMLQSELSLARAEIAELKKPPPDPPE
jgi:hypothetical protein